MKLKKIDLVAINKEGDRYIYTYAIFATSFLKKHYLKLVFKSNLPHFWWSEIQKVMINLKIYFEDLEKEKPKNIKIGTIEYLEFSPSDIKNFGTSPEEWKIHLDKACDKALKFQKEYNLAHGSPNLTGTGLWSNFDPEKEW